MSTQSVELDGMGSLRRSHRCGEIMQASVGDEVVLAGWVHRRRDHGGVIFVDLRDKSGIVQVVFRPESAPEAHERAHRFAQRMGLMVRGEIESRSDETINPNMPTGTIEVNVRELRDSQCGYCAPVRDRRGDRGRRAGRASRIGSTICVDRRCSARCRSGTICPRPFAHR